MTSSSTDQCPMSPTNKSDSGSGTCPMGRGRGGEINVMEGNEKEASTILSSWWTRSLLLSPSIPSQQTNASIVSVPASVEEANKHSQIPHPDQSLFLSTTRMVSSIPRADELRPTENAHTSPTPAPHQPPTASHWVYPSEQQFYNAMRRKGYNIEDMVPPMTQSDTAAESEHASESASPLHVIPYILQIHNAVNERTWMEICRWERELHGIDQPRLIRFIGRPKDLSPKAWLNSRLLLTKEPFDRHDWYIDRGDGQGERRYVIDFYSGQEYQDKYQNATDTNTTLFDRLTTHGFFKRFRDSDQQQTTTTITDTNNSNIPNQQSPQSKLQQHPQENSLFSSRPSMYVDVRPALDTPEALVDRIHMLVRDAFPGIRRWVYTNSSTATSPLYPKVTSQNSSSTSSYTSCPNSK